MEQLEERAREVLPQEAYNFFRQGAGSSLATHEARARWDSLRLLPRILRDVSHPSTEVEVLGDRLPGPVMVAPTFLQRVAHAGGEAEMAAGAAAAASTMVVASSAGTRFEEIAATGVSWWLQLYVLRDRRLTEQLVRRAVDCGARAVVLTVDAPIVATQAGGSEGIWDLVRPGYRMANADAPASTPDALERATDLSLETIEWVARVSGRPVVVKGVLRGDDAVACARAGAAGIVVSNHGGRQLSAAVAVPGALAEVASALDGSGAEILVDGGIRTGEHVAAALALGAKAVLVGRPALWGLAAGGAEGVAAVLRRLVSEFREAMVLLGAATPSELGRDQVRLPGQQG